MNSIIRIHLHEACFIIELIEWSPKTSTTHSTLQLFYLKFPNFYATKQVNSGQLGKLGNVQSTAITTLREVLDKYSYYGLIRVIHLGLRSFISVNRFLSFQNVIVLF